MTNLIEDYPAFSTFVQSGYQDPIYDSYRVQKMTTMHYEVASYCWFLKQ